MKESTLSILAPPLNRAHLTIQPLVPREANQGWKLELFEIYQSIVPHYHRVQRQLIVVVEGELKVDYGQVLELKSGELAQVEPGIVHSLEPLGKTRFFSIDFPGFEFPDDVFYDTPKDLPQWTRPTKGRTPLDPKYFGSKLDLKNYAVYELVDSPLTQGKWSAALLEIEDSPRHYHRIEREVFVVVEGELNIEIDGSSRVLRSSESVLILPYQIHHLKSASSQSVRVLCFSFPAFDPSDLYCVTEG